MGSLPHARRAGLRLRVGGKFLLTVGVLVPAVLTIAGVGAAGLNHMSNRTDQLYKHGLAVSQHSADVVEATLTIHETALYQTAIHGTRLNDQLTNELDLVLIPDVERAIEVLRADYSGRPQEQKTVDEIAAGMQKYLDLRATGAYDDAGAKPATEEGRTALAEKTDKLLEPVADTAKALGTQAVDESTRVKAQSDATYRSTLVLLLLSVVSVLLLGLAAVLALNRNMVPRIRRYSQFAADIAAGRPSSPLQPPGRDELTDLGLALNDMVEQRERAAVADEEQRSLTALADQSQTEFVDTLQVTRSEDEAQELLQRHLQRTLHGSSVAVLRQNNSANRLEAATPLPPGSRLAAELLGAEPRACVAIRLGRTHHEGSGRPPLLNCGICQAPAQGATCEPLLVGGEVIGSVLVTTPEALPPVADMQIKNTVGQAAPVLANLRSLALAEFRANNDSLTGLPNKRATEDTLKRMVAQANRSVGDLTAIMLDLDHFKQINDRFGHAQGDEVLAAVGAAIQSSLRTGDFAGRFGGEEFLILLPETPLDGGWLVAEKIRLAVAAISVPGVERDITASLGVAGLLDHAGNATGLLREADKAQYAAKAGGRNATVIATSTASPGAVAGVPAART